MGIANVKSTSVVIKKTLISEVYEFLSKKKAAKFLATSHSQILLYINSKQLFRGFYIIEKKRLHKNIY